VLPIPEKLKVPEGDPFKFIRIPPPPEDIFILPNA
jgi:hypothetical protein